MMSIRVTLPAYSGHMIRFQRLLFGFQEHLTVFDGWEPVGDGCGEVVATAETVTLDEGPGPEVAQTGPWRYEALAGRVRSRSVLKKLSGNTGFYYAHRKRCCLDNVWVNLYKKISYAFFMMT